MYEIGDNLRGINEENLRKKRELLKFSYAGKEFIVTLSYLGQDKSGIVLSVFDASSDDGTHAKITGGLVVNSQDEVEFHGGFFENTKVQFNDDFSATKLEGHIPRVVQETIAQVIDSEKVQKWSSHLMLTEGAQRIYEALLQDPRIDGEKEFWPKEPGVREEDSYRYILKKKQI